MTDRRHRVAVLLLPSVYGVESTVPSRILGDARGADGERLYDVRLCSLDGGPVPAVGGFGLVPQGDASLLAWAQTVVVPAAADAVEGADPAAIAALRAIPPGTRLVSLCIGAFLLAAAGRLDGRPATTHWRHSATFRRRFPQVRLTPDVLWVDDGDVLTSAGGFAAVDLCLHLLRRDHGVAVADATARRCVVAPWRDGGQAQFAPRPVPAPDAASTSTVRAWALDHLHEPLDLAGLAARAGMSVRTFTRRFRADTGRTPGQWLVAQRVDRARHLLESGDLTVDQVAAAAGFGTAASLRQHFRAALGVSPTTYRRTFRRSA